MYAFSYICLHGNVEDEPMASVDDEDDESITPLVDMLFAEIESLRMQVCPTHLRKGY